jgi:endonuclease-3
MNRQKRSEIFARLRRANPAPTTELNYASNFQLLIAVILSAQATDISVNKATEKLFKEAPSPEAMLRLGLEGVREHIKSIGLFNTKATNVIKTCQALVTRHDSQVPTTRGELEALPGVGRKTANVVLNTAFRKATVAVDTHIFRVSNRTGIAPGKNVLEVEKRLLRVVPPEYLLDAHHWLILHGRYVCTARKPGCPDCLISDLCEYRKKTVAEN